MVDYFVGMVNRCQDQEIILDVRDDGNCAAGAECTGI